MNTNTNTGEREVAETATAPKPKDHRAQLTHRDVFKLLATDKLLRPYVFTALGALAMIFFVMFLNGSDIGAIIIGMFGLATLLFRWVAGPPFLLIILSYFLLFPFGWPDTDSTIASPEEVYRTHFLVSNMILVLAVLVYMRSTYRIFGLVLQAVPFENVFRVRGEHPLRRPASHIRADEILWMIGVAVALVIIGQVAWWVVNSLEFTPNDDFPLRWDNDPIRYRRRSFEPGEFTAGANRFFVMLGVLFFGFLVVRLVFGYWRLRTMNAREGAMMLTDMSWSESHRERTRIEKWRIWGRDKAKGKTKKKTS